MTRYRTSAPTGLWGRTAKALGKFFAGMVSLPESRRHADADRVWTDYPRFPPF